MIYPRDEICQGNYMRGASRAKDIIRNRFFNHPFVFITICLIAGVLWGEAGKISPGMPGAVATGLIIAGIILSGQGKRRGLLGIVFCLAFFFLGWMRVRQENILPADHIANFFQRDTVTVVGVLERPVEEYSNRTRLYLSAEKIISPSPGEGFRAKEQQVTGLVLLDTRSPLPRLKYGDRIQVRTRVKLPQRSRNPGVFDYRTYLKRKGIYRRGWIKSAKDITLLDSSLSLKSRVFDFRNRIFDFIGDDTPEKQFLATVLLGMREKLPYELKDSFIRAGTAHLLAISGLHVGVLASFFFLIFRSIWWLVPFRMYLRLTRYVRPGKLAAVLSVPPLVGYTFLVGAGTPTVRALIMVLAYLLAIVLERDRDLYNILAMAASAIILWRPVSLREIDFLLSFVAVFFIIYVLDSSSVNWWDALEDEPGWTVRAVHKVHAFFMVSLAGYFSTLPLVSYYFKQISLVGLLGNMAIVPLFSLVLPLGFFGLILYPVSPALAGLFISACLKGSYVLVEWVRGLGEIEWASVLVYQPPVILILVVYAFYLCLGRVHRYRWARFGAVAFLLAGLLIILPGRHDNRLQVSFLDIERGDATLIRTPGGKTILIDAGMGYSDYNRDAGKNVVAPFLLHEWIKKLDYVVLSHPHADHYGGLSYIIENFTVGEFWDTAGGFRSKFFKDKLEDKIKEKEILVRYVAAGDRFDLEQDIRMEILHPPKTNSYKINDRSIVLRLVYKNVSFLFTGDLESEGEADLVATGAELASSVLKIPHHGAKTSNTMDFIKAVQPDFAVLFSAYFPKKDATDWKTIRRYRDLGIQVLETGREGCVTFYSDGDSLWLETVRGTRAVRTVTR